MSNYDRIFVTSVVHVQHNVERCIRKVITCHVFFRIDHREKITFRRGYFDTNIAVTNIPLANPAFHDWENTDLNDMRYSSNLQGVYAVSAFHVCGLDLFLK